MDFVVFETFSEIDAVPCPQPSLSIPSKPDMKNLSAKLHNFKDIKYLLKQNLVPGLEDDDRETKLADTYASLSLELLQDRPIGIPSKASESATSDNFLSHALSIRLSRTLNSNISDTRMRELFTILDPNLIDNALLIDSGIDGSLARKNLRGDVEADLLRLHSSQLLLYAKSVTNLNILGNRLMSLHTLIEESNNLLIRDTSATSDMRTEISQFMSEKDSVDLKKNLLITFRQKFVLNEYDSSVLSSKEINAEFFKALERADRINEACLFLLALDNPALGKKVMSNISTLISRANETITSFCCKTLSSTYQLNNRQTLSMLHLCLYQLRQRSDQLSVILEALVRSRSAVLLDEFNSQVDGHDSNEIAVKHVGPRPVYFSSHDPVRFITDLLAYVHSSAANESEVISGLLNFQHHLPATTIEVVNKVLLSLVFPIKFRIEEIIMVEPKLGTLSQILDVLELYHAMCGKIIHAQIITSPIEDGISLIRKKFKIVLSNRLSAIDESNLTKLDLSIDLQPPEWIIEYYSEILPIIDAMHSSTILGVSPEEHEEFLRLITQRPIEIFYKHLELVSNRFNKHETTLFKLNFLDLIVSKIMPFRLLGDIMLEINHSINDLSQSLKDVHYKSLISDCALTDHYDVMNMICSSVEDFTDASLYAAVPESKIFNEVTLTTIDEKIRAVLPSAILEFQLHLVKLNNPNLVNDIIATSSLRFVTFYKLFTEVIQNYVSPSLLAWSDIEVATLLGVETSYSMGSNLE